MYISVGYKGGNELMRILISIYSGGPDFGSGEKLFSRLVSTELSPFEVWTIFLGYHLVIKNDAELTIDAIHFKNHTAQLLLEILRDFLSLTMIVVFLIASTQFLQNSMIYPQKLSSMPVNMYVIYMVMPVSFALMALQKLTNMVVRIGNIVKPDALENTVDKGGQAK